TIRGATSGPRLRGSGLRLEIASQSRIIGLPAIGCTTMATEPLPLTPTPLVRLGNLFPERAVYAKCEFLAPSGCFKIRGAVHLLEHLSREGKKRPLVVPSMGNTALGAAVGAKEFGFSMVGVVPQTIARAKDEKLR